MAGARQVDSVAPGAGVARWIDTQAVFWIRIQSDQLLTLVNRRDQVYVRSWRHTGGPIRRVDHCISVDKRDPKDPAAACRYRSNLDLLSQKFYNIISFSRKRGVSANAF